MLFAACSYGRVKILAKKRDHVILETVCHLARVRALVDLKAIRDAIFVENIVQLSGIGAQTILVTHVDRNSAIPAEIPDVLIYKSQRCIGGPSCEDIRLRLAVLGGQVEIKRRIFRIG